MTKGQFKGNVVIKGVHRILDAFFKVDAAQIEFEGFDHNMVAPKFELLNFERGDAVAALVHLIPTDEILLVEQFRYPTYKKTGGWIYELVAGMLKDGENPEMAIVRELLEEAGYEAGETQHVMTFYVSPGGTSERIHLYYIPVFPSDEKSSGGGLEEEGESIRRFVVQLDEATKMVESGEIKDAKTIVAIQWLQLRQRKTTK
jgi:nudix-type nucleoside diphosphatase (YffH/AdpP family)